MSTNTLPFDIADEAERRAVNKFLDRVVERMAEKRYRELYHQAFDKVPPPNSDAAAIGLMKDVGEELSAAAAALDAAAERLRERGDALGARRAKEGAQRAREQAEGLVGA